MKPATVLNPATVLVCDDDLPIRRAAEIKLKRFGYNVVCACDGQDAWEQIQISLPDIVVTDCQMPRLHGVDLVRRLRSEARTARLPVIMLTAKGYELDQDELKREWNVAMVMDKPFSPRNLAECVGQTLEAAASEKPVAAV